MFEQIMKIYRPGLHQTQQCWVNEKGQCLTAWKYVNGDKTDIASEKHRQQKNSILCKFVIWNNFVMRNSGGAILIHMPSKIIQIKFVATNMMYASTIVQYCSIAEQYLTDSCFWCLTLCGLFSCGTFFEWMKIVVADMHFCWCGVLDNWKLSKYKKFSIVLSWDTHLKTHRLAVFIYILYMFINNTHMHTAILIVESYSCDEKLLYNSVPW